MWLFERMQPVDLLYHTFLGKDGSVTAAIPTPDILCHAHGIRLHPSTLAPFLTLASRAAQRLRSPNSADDMLP